MISARPERKKVDENHDWLVHLNTQHNILRKQNSALHNHWIIEPGVLNQSIDVLRRIAAHTHLNSNIVLFADVPFEHHYQAIAPYLSKWTIKVAGFKGLTLTVISDLLAKLDLSKLEMIGISNLDKDALWFLYQVLCAWCAAGNLPIPIEIGPGISKAWSKSLRDLAHTSIAESTKTHFHAFQEIIKNFSSALVLQHRYQLQLQARDNGYSVTQQLQDALAQNLDLENKFATINAELLDFKTRSSCTIDKLTLSLKTLTDTKNTADADFAAKQTAAGDRIEALNQQVRELTDQLNQSRVTASGLSTSIVSLTGTNADLVKEKASLSLSLQAEVQKGEEQKVIGESLAQTVDELEEQYSKQKDELDNSQQLLALSQHTITALGADNADLRFKLSCPGQTVDATDAHSSSSQKKRKYNSESSAQKDLLRKQLITAATRILILETEAKQLEDRLSSDVRQYNELKGKTDKQARELSSVSAQLKRARTIRSDTITQQADEIAQLKKDIIDLNTQLRASKDELVEAVRIHREAEEVNDILYTSRGSKLAHSSNVSLLLGNAHSFFTPSPLPSPNLDPTATPFTTWPTLPGFTLGGR